MTSSQTTLLLRLVAFTLAAVTLWLAFSGAALAAPAPCAPEYRCEYSVEESVGEPGPQPDPHSAPPATEVAPDPSPATDPAPEPTWEPPAQPGRSVESEGTESPVDGGERDATSVPPPAAFGEAEQSAPAVARNDVDRASDGENRNRDGIFAALLAALVAVFLGGGWLASAIARKLRTGTRS